MVAQYNVNFKAPCIIAASFILQPHLFYMKKKCSCLFTFIVFMLTAGSACAANKVQGRNDTIPALFKGTFTDDYGILYRVNDSTWEQLPNVKYHILKWDTARQYIIARNDAANPSEKGLYTRIDYMLFNGMVPYHWGFCLTVYNAVSDAAAEAGAAADRDHPRKGCNGYPFSRMKRMEP